MTAPGIGRRQVMEAAQARCEEYGHAPCLCDDAEAMVLALGAAGAVAEALESHEVGLAPETQIALAAYRALVPPPVPPEGQK